MSHILEVIVDHLNQLLRKDREDDIYVFILWTDIIDSKGVKKKVEALTDQKQDMIISRIFGDSRIYNNAVFKKIAQDVYTKLGGEAKNIDKFKKTLAERRGLKTFEIVEGLIREKNSRKNDFGEEAPYESFSLIICPPSFGQTPIERKEALELRKKQMIAKARREYVEKHPEIWDEESIDLKATYPGLWANVERLSIANTQALKNEFNEIKSTIKQHQEYVLKLMQDKPKKEKDLNDLYNKINTLIVECRTEDRLLARMKHHQYCTGKFRDEVVDFEKQASKIQQDLNGHLSSKKLLTIAQQVAEIEASSTPHKIQPLPHAKQNTADIGDYLAEQDDYRLPIALTLAGLGSVGVLAVGVSLGIITSPVLIVAGFAIAGLIPVVWLMHWLINARPALSSTQTSQPSASRFQSFRQKMIAFFSPEQKEAYSQGIAPQKPVYIAHQSRQ